MLDISKRLFHTWNEENVIYCHWKSNEHLQAGLNGDTDLDVLVSEGSRERAERVFLALHFLKCRSQYGSRYPGVEDWIGFDAETGKLIHVHLHYTLVTGHKGMKEYSLPWTQTVLEHRVADAATGVFIACPELEILTLYTRICLKATLKRVAKARSGSFSIGKDNEKEIQYLKARVNWDVVKELTDAYWGAESSVFRYIQASSLSAAEFLQLRSDILKVMQQHSRYGRFQGILYQLYYHGALRLRGVLRRKLGLPFILRKTPATRPGSIIAVIGQDGAGKSTVTSGIERWLTWKLEAERFYLGSGEHYWSWQKKLREKLPKRKNPILGALSAWLTLSDYVHLSKATYRTIQKARVYKEKGGIAIFDRYPQVKHFGINDGPKIRTNYLPKIKNKLVLKYAAHCAQVEEKYLKLAAELEPDLVLKLVLPPEESIRRKPKESIDAVQKKSEIIRKWEFDSVQVQVIDATMPLEQEYLMIKQILWESVIQ